MKVIYATAVSKATNTYMKCELIRITKKLTQRKIKIRDLIDIYS